MYYPLTIKVHNRGLESEFISGKSPLSKSIQTSGVIPFIRVQLRSEVDVELERRISSGNGVIPLPLFGKPTVDSHPVSLKTVFRILFHNLKQLFV